MAALHRWLLWQGACFLWVNVTQQAFSLLHSQRTKTWEIYPHAVKRSHCVSPAWGLPALGISRQHPQALCPQQGFVPDCFPLGKTTLSFAEATTWPLWSFSAMRSLCNWKTCHLLIKTQLFCFCVFILTFYFVRQRNNRLCRCCHNTGYRVCSLI